MPTAKRPRTSKPQLSVLSDSIAKPREDKRLYRLILLPNNLRALLISDPTVAAEEELEEHGSDGEDDEGEDDEEGAEEGDEEEGENEDEAVSGNKAACALSVGIGSLCDPPQLDGLAHFTEHMVFMGTKKFPNENEWSSFLAERGGEDNGGIGRMRDA